MRILIRARSMVVFCLRVFIEWVFERFMRRHVCMDSCFPLSRTTFGGKYSEGMEYKEFEMSLDIFIEGVWELIRASLCLF